jgi:uncharacterized damage-inducible protein DinB
MQNTRPGSGDAGSEYVAYSRRRLTKEFLPKIERCLEELSEEDLWWRGDPTNNSVGNLILHLSGNIRQWIISGIGGVPDSRNRPEEFSEQTRLPRSALLKLFRSTVEEADRVLERFDAGKLLEIRHIQRYEVSGLDAISHVVEHVAQHMGQIIYITKLRRKVDLKFFDL